MGEEAHIILVAIHMRHNTREGAMELIATGLNSSPILSPHAERGGLGHVEAWWIAEDDRVDGSDCDSAVFVFPGMQHTAAELLLENELTTQTSKDEYATRPSGRW